MHKNIVFFDGYCILCNGLVDFLLKADKKTRLKFASLQGDTAQKYVSAEYSAKVDTVLFYDEDARISIKSGAIINIFKTMGGLWKLVTIFSLLPSSFLDIIYDFIARKRYSWFGKREQCRVPGPDQRDRILP